MLRPILLTTVVASGLVCISSSSFAASVVDNSAFSGRLSGVAGKAISHREIERLLTGTKTVFAVKSLSLSDLPAGSHTTLTGTCVTLPGAEVVLPESSVAAALSMDSIATAADVSPAPAPAANVGSASAFGAVPEPSSVALLAFGGLAFLRRRRA